MILTSDVIMAKLENGGRILRLNNVGNNFI